MSPNKIINKSVKFLLNSSIDEIILAPEFLDQNCSIKHRDLSLVFPIGFTLHALSFLKKKDISSQLDKKIKTLIKYLQNQESEIGTFNYWIKESENYKLERLPDDLDDTAFCYQALFKWGVDPKESTFLSTIEIERKVGGPYNTWYIDYQKFNKFDDIDPVVNANFLYYAGLCNIDLPPLKRYISKCLKTKKIKSIYYPYEEIFLLYASRYVSIQGDKKLKNLIVDYLENIDFDSVSNIQKLMLANIYLNLDLLVDERIKNQLLKMQNADGGLDFMPICHGHMNQKRDTYVGSAISATALFLEFMIRYESKNSKFKEVNIIEDEIKKTKSSIVNEIESKTGRKISKYLLKYLNSKSIKLPLILTYVLTKGKKKDFDKMTQKLDSLYKAIWYIWHGYTIIDDLIDNDNNKNKILDVATMLRLGYQNLFSFHKFTEVQNSLYDSINQMEDNYRWEIEKARFSSKKDLENKLKNNFSDYKYISKRMSPFTHIMSYLILVLGEDQKKSKAIKKFVNNLLIIDQLNDDAHDFEEDYKNGIITYVLAYTIREYDKQKKSSKKEIFWLKTIPHITHICQNLFDEAKSEIEKIDHDNYLLNILQKTMKPILQAQQGVVSTKKIISAL